MKQSLPRRRAQTLFYTDAVNLLRRIYPPPDYEYRDDFDGEVLITRGSDLLLSVEIKSEVEADAISTTNGAKFADVRTAINSLSGLTGKQKGWMACLAQCWDYMQTGLPSQLTGISFSDRQDVLIMPSDREAELVGALQAVKIAVASCPIPTPYALRYPAENMCVYHYGHAALMALFESLKGTGKANSEPEGPGYGSQARRT